MKKSKLIAALALSTLFSSTAALAADMTREEFAEEILSMAYKSAITVKADDENKVSFSDTENEAVLTLASLDIVKGKSESEFAPNDSLTRQEAAVILYRFVDKKFTDSDISLHPEYNFDDSWKIADWATDAIDYMYYYNVILGVEPYVINPTENLTAEQGKLMAQRVIQYSDKYKAIEETPDFEWAIEPIYDGLKTPNTSFSGGLCAVKNSDGYGYINTKGEEVIPCKFDDADNFSCGMARVTVDGKFGYINKNGEMIIPAEYDKYSRNFSEDLVALEKDGKFGFADKNGKLVIPFVYDYAYDFSEGIAPVKKNGLYGFIDKTGKIVIDFKWSWASSFKEGYARVSTKKGAFSYIDHSGEIALDLDYDYLFEFNEGTAVVFNNDTYALIRKDGSFIAYFKDYGWIFPSHNGLIRVHPYGGYPAGGFYESSYGYLDAQTGKQVIPYDKKYDASDFSESLAVIQSHSNRTDRVYWSYMNKKGKYVLPKRSDAQEKSKFDDDAFYIMAFHEGYAAVVNMEGKLGFVKNPLF